jgi:hypothetical protein
MGFLRTTMPSSTAGVVTLDAGAGAFDLAGQSADLKSAAAAGGKNILLGLGGLTYYNSFFPLLNWYKGAEATELFVAVTFTGGGSPNVLLTAHNLEVNDAFSFQNTGGALPAAITAGPPYFVKTVVNANTFTVSASQGGPVINMATAGTGVHTIYCSGLVAWHTGRIDPATGDIKPNLGVTKREEMFFTHPADAQRNAGANYDGETWVAEWDGTGTGFIMNLTPGGSQTPVGSNKITFTMGTPQNAGVKLQLTVTNQADPPVNPRVYQARYTTNVTNGELTNPDWRVEMAKFPTLRFMDWQYTNNSNIMDFSQLATENYYRWGQQLNYITDVNTGLVTSMGPKGGIHPSIICKTLNETGCKGHVNIPTAFTDAAVLEFATYMRDHTTKHVTYEFSNEIFHYGFYQMGYAVAQGKLLGAWPTDGDYYQGLKWYGYRSAQVMKIIRDTYADTSRWSGGIISQATGIDPMTQALAGVNYWISSTLSPLHVNDLFRATYYGPYYGACTDGLGLAYARPILDITKANPAVVTSTGHGLSNGARIKLFIRGGMTQLNNTFCTVANVTVDTFQLSGVNSTGYTTFAADNNYWVPAALWDLMDASEALYPGTNPSPYTYFNDQYKQACLTGTCAAPGVVLPYPLTFFQSVWVNQKALADTYGLQMRQYEAGNHFVGAGAVTQYGGEPQLNRFVIQWGHSQDSADVEGAFLAAWNTLGGFESAKFQEAGGISQFGCWAGIRYWPTVANGGTTDINNPLWQTITYYNQL